MTLGQMVRTYGQVPYSALIMIHDNYDVLIGEKKYTTFKEYEEDPERYDSEYLDEEHWFSGDYLISGVETLVEEMIMNLLSNECGVSELFYVHLIENYEESYTEDDFVWTEEKREIRHVFEVHVDTGKDFLPTGEEPYYSNYGTIERVIKIA